MGRSPCCEKVGLKKGPWTPEEDQKLLAYIEEHGHGSWRALPAKAGLQRCGKSCRLRWTNYLRPDIKRGKFSLQEEQTIIQLHALLGNRWSAIATHLPKRTDNEIKNYWNTHLKKRLAKMGIDPVTHKPKTDALGYANPKDAANLSHMAQWENARLEAEARLVRESKLLPPKPANLIQNQLTSSAMAQLLNKAAAPPLPPCLDILRAWQGTWYKSTKDTSTLDSPLSTLNYPDKTLPIPTVGFGSNSTAAIQFAANGSGSTGEGGLGRNEGDNEWKCYGKLDHSMEYKERLDHPISLRDVAYPTEGGLWISGNMPLTNFNFNFTEGLTDILIDENNDNGNSSDAGENIADNGQGSYGGEFEDHANYWNSILNLVNSSPSDSPVF